MNGQKNTYKEKDRTIRKYISLVNPYKTHKPLKYDLRKYAAYVRDHNLRVEDISEDVMSMFRLG